MKLPRHKEQILTYIADVLQRVPFVLSAGVYGSWLYHLESSDIDIALVIKSKNGVVDSESYRIHNQYRTLLSEEICMDVDLVPHTEDEIDDLNSPLWYPKSNPSLCYLYPLVGTLLIKPITAVRQDYKLEDVAAFLIHENRTVCRRQLTRTVTGECGRIFVSKMLHGTANALTYYACRGRSGFVCTPSDLNDCFNKFDFYFDLDSRPAKEYLFESKKTFNFNRALNLMKWYEHLLGFVLYGCPTSKDYNDFCKQIAKIKKQLTCSVVA